MLPFPLLAAASTHESTVSQLHVSLIPACQCTQQHHTLKQGVVLNST